jgi:hypothetical protein
MIADFNAQRGAYSELLGSFLQFAPFFNRIVVQQPPSNNEPFWFNSWIPSLDTISLYSLVAMRNPRNYIEVGSGNSTKFVKRAIDDHNLRTRIISIDPQPRAEIDEICDEVHRFAFEDFDLSFFDKTTADDILFIDSSHLSVQSSDVTVFFMEVLGRLSPGMLYGLHDILLPFDYPKEWASRIYNEQYLLAAYLFGGADGDKVILPNCYISNDIGLIGILDPVWKSPGLVAIEAYGSTLWMERGYSYRGSPLHR